MHGGLSPELLDANYQQQNNTVAHESGLEKINQIQRPCDVPDSGLLCDILWSDPDPSVEVSTVLLGETLNINVYT